MRYNSSIKNGNVGIATTTPTEVLSVNGNVSIEGTNCRDSGGSATCNNFVDIAELFHSSEEVDSGDVVIIDFESEKEENKKSLNQAETVQPESLNSNNKYINLLVNSRPNATVAQSGRASASRA